MSQPSRRTFLGAGLGAAGLLGLSARPLFAGPQADPAAMTDKAIAFLKGRQGADGTWSTERKEPGITALVVTGLLRSKRVPASDPVVAKGLAYLEQYLSPSAADGAFPHGNYAVAVALMAVHEANQGGKYDALVKTGQAFLKAKQWDDSEQKGRDDVWYGGAGYGGVTPSRPDLSNTSFMLEALHDSGVPASDPAFQKALVFVSRCQNLKGEFNDQPWADKINDGGFIYTPHNGGTSVAGKDEATGGLRSYGSMTYAGLRSLIYAGLTADDPRVKAATSYIAKHYTVDENPGLDQAALYYYYQAFAKTLAALGQDKFVDDKGTAHDWRSDLIGALAKRQDANGSWVNSADRFMEGDANLVTAYALLALAYAKKA